MTVSQIFQTLSDGGFVALILMALIEISPIKINPWKAIAKFFGKAVNGEMLDKIQTIDQKVCALETKMDEMNESSEEQKAINERARILRFGDEVLHGQNHTKDHFDSVLKDARNYQRYCASHPTFENGVTEPTIERIKAVYQKRLEEHDFL